ncbi:MAG: DUF2380 domain-containing protein [Rhizobiaceae bacterium]
MRIATFWVAGLAVVLAGGVAQAQDGAKLDHIAVFHFELEDKSAGAGIIPPDEYDLKYLAESTAKAKQMLAASRRYDVIDAPSGDDETPAPHGLRNCGGCEVKIAERTGASLALLGVVTRVNRTEHTMFIRILDVNTGSPVAQGFTDLRMGANYAWPRSVKWLMDHRILQRN